MHPLLNKLQYSIPRLAAHYLIQFVHSVQRFCLKYSTCWRLSDSLEADLNLFGRPELSFSLRHSHGLKVKNSKLGELDTHYTHLPLLYKNTIQDSYDKVKISPALLRQQRLNQEFLYQDTRRYSNCTATVLYIKKHHSYIYMYIYICTKLEAPVPL